jgi:hypothetical protein
VNNVKYVDSGSHVRKIQEVEEKGTFLKVYGVFLPTTPHFSDPVCIVICVLYMCNAAKRHFIP